MEDKSSKLMRKIKNDPIIPVGLLGLTSVLIYGLYKFKSKSKDMKTSIYLIHLRLAAQGTLMGTITLGVLYSIIKNNYPKFFNKNE